MQKMSSKNFLRIFLTTTTFLFFTESAFAAGNCQFNRETRLNDDFCDCPLTGEDELLTSACSSTIIAQPMFACKSHSSFDQLQLFPSRIGDGICDCCDGEDELGKRTQEEEGKISPCVNTCLEKEQEYHDKFVKQKQLKTNGEKLFLQLVKKVNCEQQQEQQPPPPPAQEAETEEKVSSEDVEKLENLVEQLQNKLEMEQVEHNIKSLHLQKLTKEQLQQVLIKLTIQMKSGITLERFVQDVLPCVDNGDEDEYGIKKQDSTQTEPEQEEEEGDCDPVWSESDDSEELELAKERLKELRDKMSPSKIEETQEDDKDVDYGPGQVWKAYKGQCFSLRKEEQYTYELCLFSKFTQDHVSLGKWHGWILAEDGQKYSTMKFDGGEMCYSPAIPRSIKVKVTCGLENKVIDVIEPSTCVYEAYFESPAACIPDQFDADQYLQSTDAASCAA
jgi:protein kinase C substrate 80K-H